MHRGHMRVRAIVWNAQQIFSPDEVITTMGDNNDDNASSAKDAFWRHFIKVDCKLEKVPPKRGFC